LIEGYSKIYSNREEAEENADNIIKTIDHNNSGKIDFSGNIYWYELYYWIDLLL